VIRFGRFQLEPAQGLRRGAREVHLTPKALAVLCTLAGRAGQVVSKEDLFRAVWPDTAVSDSALASCIKELRQALGDDAQRPRFLETVHRRGFRFIPGVTTEGSGTGVIGEGRRPPADVSFVGREGVLQSMRAALASAEAGVRQVLFLTGEPGVGKSAVIDAFVTAVGLQHRLRVTGAGCVERTGAGEPYQPLLEALTRLCRRPGGSPVVPILDRCAPTWLAQLPSVQTPARLATLRQRTAGVTRDRMLRELTDALETLTAQTPLVLWLEDLHWSDPSTVDWIAAFARRREPARVMIIGTLRPAEVQPFAGSLPAAVDALRVKGLCQEIALAGLDADAFDAFVASRHPAAAGAEADLKAVAALVRIHTDGNPLFASNVLADLVARGNLIEQDARWRVVGDVQQLVLGVPDDVRRVIERQFDRLDAGERELLEAASVPGLHSSSAAIAAGANRDQSDTEITMAGLARQGRFLRDTGTDEWPDGTIAARFGFVHSLYREVVHGRLPAARRAELHIRTGRRLEQAYGDRATEIATQLAVHFEEGRDLRRATLYLEQAARTAMRRNALHEAERHLRRALALLPSLAASTERDEREIALRIGLGGVLMTMQGWGAPEVETTYARARELCRQLGDTPQLFPSLWGLWLFYWGRGSLERARALADTLLSLAREAGDRGLLLQAHHALWATCFSTGDLADSHDHAVQGIALYREEDVSLAASYGNHDAGVCALAFDARTLALLGQLDEAVHAAEKAIALARDLAHPFTLTLALVFGAAVHQFRRDPAGARRYAAEAAALSREQSFRLTLGWASILEGWAAIELGDDEIGSSLMSAGIAGARSTGSDQFLSYWLGMLADAHLTRGSAVDGLAAVDEALGVAERTGEFFYEAELHRLRGELRLVQRPEEPAEAEVSFRRALEIAERQGAGLLALRASVSLERLRRRGDGLGALPSELTQACSRVTGVATLPDLREARELLAGNLPSTSARLRSDRRSGAPSTPLDADMSRAAPDGG
jgi:DNA-binding winged helix-turn-helix (wHTH) protein/predicted ATPase